MTVVRSKQVEKYINDPTDCSDVREQSFGFEEITDSLCVVSEFLTDGEFRTPIGEAHIVQTRRAAPSLPRGAYTQTELWLILHDEGGFFDGGLLRMCVEEGQINTLTRILERCRATLTSVHDTCCHQVEGREARGSLVQALRRQVGCAGSGSQRTDRDDPAEHLAESRTIRREIR